MDSGYLSRGYLFRVSILGVYRAGVYLQLAAFGGIKNESQVLKSVICSLGRFRAVHEATDRILASSAASNQMLCHNTLPTKIFQQHTPLSCHHKHQLMALVA